MKRQLFGAALAVLASIAAAGPAAAAVSISAVPGSSTYSGPTPTFTFDGATPEWSGAIRFGSVWGVAARPLGSTGGFATTGPTDGGPSTLDLSGFYDVLSLTFIWGSADKYNLLEVLGLGGTVLDSFTGSDVSSLANGARFNPSTNPLVTLSFSGGDESNVTGLRFTSPINGFEIDNVAVQAVPEPSTWALMLLGFGAVGYAMRRRRRIAGPLVQAA